MQRTLFALWNTLWKSVQISIAIILLIGIGLAQPAIAQTNCAGGTLSGIKWDDRNGDGKHYNDLIQGNKPDVFFVIDVSASTTSSSFEGNTFEGNSGVGDVNQDGKSNTILDAEIAGFEALNQQLIQQGLGDRARLTVVAFGETSAALDLDPVTPGVQVATSAGADHNGNGIPDLVEAFTQPRKAFEVGKNTNFQAALDTVITTLGTLGTEPGNGNVIFLSDGFPNRPRGQAYVYYPQVQLLRDQGVKLSAFGVGDGSSLKALEIIDPLAQVFTATDEMIAVFEGLQSRTRIPANSVQVEPGLANVTVYLDLNGNGQLDFNEPARITDQNGHYRFDNLAPGPYTVRELLPSGYRATAPVKGVGQAIVEANQAVTVDFGNQLLPPEPDAQTTDDANAPNGASPKAPLIVDIDAKVNNQKARVVKPLTAGDYRVTLIGPATGGQYDAWSTRDTRVPYGCDGQGKNCHRGWTTSYRIASEAFFLKLKQNGLFATPDLAQANSLQSSVLFTLPEDAPVEFYIYNSSLDDNQGGVSLKLEAMG